MDGCAPEALMEWWVGTSGYSYTAWKGSFYPEDLPAARMLEHYGQQLNAVEINNTAHGVGTGLLSAILHISYTLVRTFGSLATLLLHRGAGPCPVRVTTLLDVDPLGGRLGAPSLGDRERLQVGGLEQIV